MLLLLLSTAHIHNDSQIAIHPVDRSRRELSDGPLAIILYGDETFRKPDLEFPSRGEGTPVSVKVLDAKCFRELACKTSGDELLGGFEVGALIGGDVEAGEDAFVVLDDIDSKGDVVLLR